MSRRKSGIFDPDYRAAGWNKSSYAPKNGGMSMTQTAALFAAAIVCLYYLGIPAVLPQAKPFIHSMPGIGVGAVIYFTVFIFLGVQIRRREFKRLRKRYGIRTEEELNAPEVKARRESAKIRAKAAGDFEKQVASVLRSFTKHTVVIVGGRGDGGVDIEIRNGTNVVGIVQCKQRDERTALPPSYIRELAAVKVQRGIDIAYLVTTARFTSESHEEAAKYGIKLIDGAYFAELRAKADTKIFGQAIK